MVSISFFNIPHLSYGRGGENWIKEVAMYLHDKGYHVKVITTDCCKRSNENYPFEYVNVKYKHFLGLSWVSYKELGEAINDSDLVYAFFPWAGTHFAVARIKTLVVFGHHAIINRNLGQRIYYGIINSLVKGDKYYHHALTNYYAEQLKRKGFKNVFIIPNFVDTQKFYPREKRHDSFVVFSPGVVTYDKGVDILVEVAKNLTRNNGIKFIVTGVEKPKVQLPPNVEYVGMLNAEDYVNTLCRSHVIFLPSRADSFSISVLEGLSCGLPATLSTLPIFRELYNYNDAVMMCSGIECYIKSLLKLYESWKRRDYEELSKNSRELAMKYNKNEIIYRLERKFNEIIKLNSN